MTYDKVKIIERMELPLDYRTELLLIYANQKPADFLQIHEFDGYADNTKFLTDGNGTIMVPDKRFSGICRDILAVGLRYEYIGSMIGMKYADEKYDQIIFAETKNLIVSHDEKLIGKLRFAFDSNDELELGRLFGFPETAISAYLGDIQKFEGYMDDKTPKGFFTQFVFSKDHFMEEYRGTSLRWHDTVKRLSSRLYDEIRYFQKNHMVIMSEKPTQEDLEMLGIDPD